MTIYLGIETSCDDTGIAIFRDGEFVCEKLSSQEKLHAVYGGVVPEIASRNHIKMLPLLFEETLKEASISPEDIDVVCVARGPGLMGSLLVGLGFAKGLTLSLGCALVGVNHLYAHLLACLIENYMEFPAIGLLISGGHTHIYYIRNPLNFELKGRTLDDAVGEAFDKVAKLLNLPYPGGKFVDFLAQRGKPDLDLFPVPYIDNRNLDFSFSGIKTAVLNYVKVHPEIRFNKMPEDIESIELSRVDPELCGVCSSFNHSVARALRIKLERAIKMEPTVKSILVAGGVAANSIIRDYLTKVGEKYSIPIFFPKKELCTDNGSMIAYAGKILYESGFKHTLNIDAVPRGKPVPWDYMKFH